MCKPTKAKLSPTALASSSVLWQLGFESINFHKIISADSLVGSADIYSTIVLRVT